MSTETPKPSSAHLKRNSESSKPAEAEPVASPTTPAVREPGFVADSDLPDDVACDECGHCGTQEPDDCDVCDGDGYLKCFDCGGAHNVKCETCKGSRTVRCDDCHGTGDGEICDISCGDCEDMRYQVAADAEFLWRRDLGRNITNGTAALYVKFAVNDYRAALVAKAESEAA